MSVLRARVRGRARRWWSGGRLTTYPAERLWDEVVYVAYYLHWSHAEILDLDHATRTTVIPGGPAKPGNVQVALGNAPGKAKPLF